MDKSSSELLAPVIKEVYSDTVAPAMREFGKLGADAAKVVRLALFPVQFGAMMQDRLARYLTQALDKVPEENRVKPRDAILLPVAEQLRHQDEVGNPIAPLYVNLLARAMDRERLGDAHPAFVQVIGQLAPDELLLLQQLQDRPYRVFVRFGPDQPALLRSDVVSLLSRSGFSGPFADDLLDGAASPELLAQPELFLTFLEHLVSLGLVEYTNVPKTQDTRDFSVSYLGFEHHFVRLTRFGGLFLRACAE